MEIGPQTKKVLKPTDLEDGEFVAECCGEGKREIKGKNGMFKTDVVDFIGGFKGDVYEISVFAFRLAPKNAEGKITIALNKKYLLTKKDDDSFWIKSQ